MLLLPQADREQSAAFIVSLSFSLAHSSTNRRKQRDERVLVVWSESLDRIVPLCNDVDERLIKLLWRSRPGLGMQGPGSVHTSGPASAAGSVDHSSAEAFVTGAGAGGMGRHGKTGSVNGLRQVHMKNGSIVKGLYGEQGREYDDVVDEKEREKKGMSTHDAAVRLGQQQQHSVSSSSDQPHHRTAYKRTWYGKKVSVQGDPALEFGSLGQDGSYESTAFGTDEESGLVLTSTGKRPVRLYASLYSGLAAGLAVLFVGNGVRTLLIEWRLDGGFVRFALLGALPLLYCVSLVSCDSFYLWRKKKLILLLVLHFADYPECHDDVCLPSPFFSLFPPHPVLSSPRIGPIAHFHKNSKYYSAIKPAPNKVVDNQLPQITIQMPVYKESLESVLAPSIRSLKKAMQTYARQGGTSTIFVCDDGLRVSF